MNSKAFAIGVDIDGVLTDFESFVLTSGKKYFEKKYNMQIADPNGFDVDQVFGATKKQLRKFWELHYVRYCILLPCRMGAREAISRLRENGSRIIIITGRMLSYEKNFLGAFMRSSVKLWLWKNGIAYDKIVFCPEHDHKTELCNDLGIDIMIEDKPQNVRSISKSIPTICMNASYNQGCEGENITRVSNWEEIYKVIEEMMCDL